MENTTARNRLPARWKLPGLSGAKLKPPGPGLTIAVKASATMITISTKPVMISTRSEIAIPLYARYTTKASPTTTQIHHGIVTPYSCLMEGSSTTLARNDRVRAPTGGSQTEKNTPAKKPALGCTARAIHVYQPPADGTTLANCAADTA